MDHNRNKVHQWVWLILILFLGVGFFWPLIGLAAIVCMLAPVAMSFFKGRKWCGFYCPRGSFNDIILLRFSKKNPIPEIFKSIRFRVGFLLIIMAAFGLQVVVFWGNPKMLGLVFLRMVLLTTFLTIILGLLYKPRTWCAICPMGTLAHLVTKLKNIKDQIEQVTFKEERCASCQICSKNCPMGINLLAYQEEGRVLDGDCLKCRTCVAKCPKQCLEIAR